MLVPKELHPGPLVSESLKDPPNEPRCEVPFWADMFLMTLMADDRYYPGVIYCS